MQHARCDPGAICHEAAGVCRLVPPKAARRYDDCLTYSMVSAKKALQMAGLDPKENSDAFEASPSVHQPFTSGPILPSTVFLLEVWFCAPNPQHQACMAVPLGLCEQWPALCRALFQQA